MTNSADPDQFCSGSTLFAKAGLSGISRTRVRIVGYVIILVYIKKLNTLTFTTVWANSADDKPMIFSCFSQKIGIYISRKLSPNETIHMKGQSLFILVKKK